MLKGDVFQDQYFSVDTFALFIDTFLAGNCGIVNGFQNSMSMSYENNNVTVSKGVCCIKGRFAREDSTTTISAPTSGSYFCKLIIEIDLDKINEVGILKQAQYKMLTSTSNYPTTTKTDIVNNLSGIYQYELAQFMCKSGTISDFVDLRTYLDFDSFYNEIREHIQEIDDESIFVLKTSLEQTLTNYVTNASLNTRLSSYATNTSVTNLSNLMQGDVAYNNDSGTNAKSITMSKNINGGYKRVKIFYRWLRDSYYQYQVMEGWIYKDSSGNYIVSWIWDRYLYSSTGKLKGSYAKGKIQNTTLSITETAEWEKSLNDSSSGSNTNYDFLIYKVIFYKW